MNENKEDCLTTEPNLRTRLEGEQKERDDFSVRRVFQGKHFADRGRTTFSITMKLIAVDVFLADRR